MPNTPFNYTPTVGAPRRPNEVQPGGGPTTGGGGTGGSTGGGSTTTTSGGGTQFNYDPRIGQGPLPPNQWGAQNRAYVREPRQEELSSYQLNQMTNQNNPLMRSARARAEARSAGRGSINSSMAGEAGQRAVIDAATPFAMQDAAAYGQAASENQQYLNQRDLANMEMENSQRNYDAQLASAQMGNEFELQRQRERLAYEGEQSELGRQYGFNMAGMENQFQTGRDWLQNQFGTEQDYRRAQIQSGLNEQDFRFQQMGEMYRYGNQARQDAFRSVLELTMNSPEEMDEFISSGMMEFFNNFANQYFGPAFSNIYGGGGGRP